MSELLGGGMVMYVGACESDSPTLLDRADEADQVEARQPVGEQVAVGLQVRCADDGGADVGEGLRRRIGCRCRCLWVVGSADGWSPFRSVTVSGKLREELVDEVLSCAAVQDAGAPEDPTVPGMVPTPRGEEDSQVGLRSAVGRWDGGPGDRMGATAAASVLERQRYLRGAGEPGAEDGEVGVGPV